ncbi:MAG: sigma-54-dependent Fis family transcriptional regulator [Cryomorphaceae bacterium]|jgi:DNA-binding NtrC family response regulator|nr:sigma-54-dependent Fis family transcriptional regulator [Cryomorphaceae bacterium]MBT3684590.1 sigma-54-dependent Fis family transcriptional regulator [Cryomorphaceae bacterium]MBT4237417.1 sigma-54-dependent Fis family transcriptional regulator [Cryomorphaceae bacterium]MBT4813056.1 sigma-54-dependent Fis family transcriptional regulator [Cryomorphaceae bacterium]MBT5417356.1 sigma-54-dependent Fis family transcriptional regulator [Cryomorphaceae bacterium]|tara:strand:- start:1082 stop:2248 length:1167 start_codon:yes stop_codon:yes gene_type:complete
MSKILIIEDEEPIRRVLVRILTEEDSSFEIHQASDGKKGLDLIKKESFDLVLCDIKMPKVDGIELLQRTRKTNLTLPFIMLTGHGNIETAVESMKLGAYDFISKPPDLNRLINSVRNALERKELVTENKILRQKVAKKYEIIGNSEPVMEIHAVIDKVAQTEARVLITGESGTGKELVAHNIHEKSTRSKGTFIEVNCAAIPSELIESELFGHLKGSFTSAVKDRQGKFEAANNGTLFLDEIGDMSLAAQAKVLRALEESKIQRVGSQRDISVDVRVIAATNKDLKKEIENGNFREDLYHRLAVIMIEVPELSKRKSDIPILVSHFSKLISQEQGIETKEFNPDSLKLLENYEWSGNIRELRNVIERLIILGGNPISKDDVNLFASKK